MAPRRHPPRHRHHPHLPMQLGNQGWTGTAGEVGGFRGTGLGRVELRNWEETAEVA